MKRLVPIFLCLELLTIGLVASAAASWLPPHLRASSTPVLEKRGPRAISPAENVPRNEDEPWWTWEKPPEFGPGALKAEGVQLWGLNGRHFRFEVKLGSFAEYHDRDEALREAQKSFNQPVTRGEGQSFLAEDDGGKLSASQASQMLQAYRFVRFVVSFP